MTDKETCFNDVNGTNVKLAPNEEIEHPYSPLGGYRKLKIEEINLSLNKKKKEEPKVLEEKMEDDK